jgi:hypothetical protein
MDVERFLSGSRKSQNTKIDQLELVYQNTPNKKNKLNQEDSQSSKHEYQIETLDSLLRKRSKICNTD